MKVLYLNIFEGCKEPDRLERIVAFLKKEDPDIFGLSELYDWEKNNFAKLKYFLQKVGFRHYIFGHSNANRHVCLFSKIPADKFEVIKITQAEKDNALIKADYTIGIPHPLTVVLAHLRAKNEDVRLAELEILLPKLDITKPQLFMGDMNSLSPQDSYDEEALLSKMREQKIKKFGRGKVRREAISKILNFGFIDAVRKFSNHPEYSVPTPYNTDPNHLAKLRLDYIFVTKSLLPDLLQALIVRNKETEKLSDHYPVVAEFR